MDPAVAALTFIVMEDRHAKYKLDLLLSLHHIQFNIKKPQKHLAMLLRL
jgi:hypothetical protein